MPRWIKTRNLLCIDWDEHSLRVLDASFPRSSVQVRAAVHVPLAPGTDVSDPASLGEFLRRVLAEHRIRTRRALVDIPRQEAVLNLLSLPDGTTDELAAMVHMQIGKELPFPKEQAVIDFAMAREEGANKCDVWVAATRSAAIDHYARVFTSAGLKLERIGLRPHANVAGIVAGGIREGRTLVVDVGPAMTEIDVIRDGRLVYSRAASVSVPATGLLAAPPAPEGASDAPAADAVLLSAGPPRAQRPLDALLVEVGRTIEAYRATDPGARLDRIVLAGTGGVDRAVAEAFTERFRVPASLFELPEGVPWPADRDSSPAPFSAVLGLALSNLADPTQHFNMLHPKEPEAQRRERVKRMPIAGATAAVFAATLAVLAYNPIRQKNAEVEAYEAQIEDLGQGEDERQKMLGMWDDLDAWARRSVIWVDQVKRLVEVFPSNEEAYVTKLDFTDTDAGGAITVDVVAVNKSVATGLVSSIEGIRAEAAEGQSAGTLLFTLPAGPEEALEKGSVPPDLRQAFADHKAVLGPKPSISVEVASSRWLVVDGDTWYRVRKVSQTDGTEVLKAYRVRTVQLFEAKPGNSEANRDDPKYTVKDKVFVSVKPDKPPEPPASKKSKKKRKT